MIRILCRDVLGQRGASRQLYGVLGAVAVVDFQQTILRLYRTTSCPAWRCGLT